ncbi:cytochrome C [Rhodanobacter sp. FDAARGOS 1247]|uniref:cytochrome C n=1 Tax=Rhodanobacter sp. FDAARGOS 1247 TaxID=2778082 RepID=UPI001950CAC5|nr:cytochrome C [Rhodanobacter sp. FDAARGOS 1247]QRP63262.1 cytochrome C [Rhodanobacter sp. FDAARGOS 1247]
MLPFLNRPANRRPLNPWLWHGLALLLLVAGNSAQATPSFARQTGYVCAVCHASAYGGGDNGPALTPTGMRFKINGYTEANIPGALPLAAQLTLAHTNPARGEDRTRLTEADIYLAGRLTDHVGGFVKIETDNVGGGKYNTKLSNLDLRFVAKSLKLGGKDLTLGVSVNNNPGFNDPLAVLPAASTLGPPGVTGTLLNLSSPAAPANHVIGATVYGLYDSNWYGEVGTYNSLQPSVQDRLGYSLGSDPGRLSDTGYFRFAYMREFKTQFFSAGVVGLSTRRQRPRLGPADDITDLGYDLSYQYLGNRQHIVQLSYVNIFEKRDYGSTPPSPVVPGLLALSHGDARDQIATAIYTFKQSYGIAVSHMVSTGSRDPARYIPYGSPDTTSNLVSVFWVPFGKESFNSLANLRIYGTWFRFSRFNGAGTNIFGAPPGAPATNARDLDAFTISVSAAF